jgi:hypothetical protein
VSDLAFLIDHPQDDSAQALAVTLGRYRASTAKHMLVGLCQHPSSDVRESAAESLLDLYGDDARTNLTPLLPDGAITRAIDEHTP